MNKNIRLLVLTDPKGHSTENSLYALLQSLHQLAPQHPIAIASRSEASNHSFFTGQQAQKLTVVPMTAHFSYASAQQAFSQEQQSSNPADYTAIWLRLPPPVDRGFLAFLEASFPNSLIFNQPSGIWESGSKGFLTHFPDICPPMQLCTTLADINAFRQRFPIVLKPLRNYGGQGLIKIAGEEVWVGKEKQSWNQLTQQLRASHKIAYLGVKYLTQVQQGDKRIVVVDGQVIGASLRLPAADSWLCNVAMGGRSVAATIDEDEKRIVARVQPVLAELGVLMYGIDTLVGDDGKRCLSELNTTSIGGLAQMAAQLELPLVEQAAELIWQYIYRKLSDHVI